MRIFLKSFLTTESSDLKGDYIFIMYLKVQISINFEVIAVSFNKIFCKNMNQWDHILCSGDHFQNQILSDLTIYRRYYL